MGTPWRLLKPDLELQDLLAASGGGIHQACLQEARTLEYLLDSQSRVHAGFDSLINKLKSLPSENARRKELVAATEPIRVCNALLQKARAIKNCEMRPDVLTKNNLLRSVVEQKVDLVAARSLEDIQHVLFINGGDALEQLNRDESCCLLDLLQERNCMYNVQVQDVLERYTECGMISEQLKRVLLPSKNGGKWGSLNYDKRHNLATLYGIITIITGQATDEQCTMYRFSPKRNKDDDPWVLKGAGTEGSTPHAAFFAKSNVNASGPENSSTTSLPSHANATMGPSNASGKGLLEEPVHAAAQKLDCVST